MKKSQLKQILAPIVKEIITEMLVSQQGILKSVIKECLSATLESSTIISESRAQQTSPNPAKQKPRADVRKMLEQMSGNERYSEPVESLPIPPSLQKVQKSFNGVNIFEGLEIISTDDNDSEISNGVDLGAFYNSNIADKWAKIKQKVEK